MNQHVNEDDLSEFVQGICSTDLSEAVARHVEECSHCAHQVSNLKRKFGRTEHDPRNHGKADLVALAREAISMSQKYSEPKLIALGGQAVVFEARSGGCLVAIKVVPKISAENKLRKGPIWTRLQREFVITRGIEHPTIASALEFIDHWDGCLALVFEKAPGATLARHVELNGPISFEIANEILAQVIEAMIVYASWGIVHRDLSPNNILVAVDQARVAVTLIDFGIAKSPRTADDEELTFGPIGTPGYIAPEMLRNWEDVTIAADVYGVARSIGFALHKSSLRRRYEKGFIDLPRSCPGKLQKLLRWMTQENPSNRPSPEKIRDALSTLRKNKNALTTLSKKHPQSLLWTVMALSVFAIILLLIRTYGKESVDSNSVINVVLKDTNSEQDDLLLEECNTLDCVFLSEAGFLNIMIDDLNGNTLYRIVLDGDPHGWDTIYQGGVEGSVLNRATSDSRSQELRNTRITVSDGYVSVLVDERVQLACEQDAEIKGKVSIRISGRDAQVAIRKTSVAAN